MEQYQLRDCWGIVSSLYWYTWHAMMLMVFRLIDFFRFFSHDFQFNNSVMSLRAGQLTKESKGWVNDVSYTFSPGTVRRRADRSRLMLEVSMKWHETETGFVSR